MEDRTAQWPTNPTDRAAAVAAVGLRTGPPPNGTVPRLEKLAIGDPDPRVRAVALGAVVRLAGRRAAGVWRRALADDAPDVRRRACELAPAVRPRGCAALVAALADADPGVAEAAAFALGELGSAARAAGAVTALAGAAAAHGDPLVREAAVAALGSLGDPGGLPAVLRGCADRPAIRRRAVVALAAFEGPDVEAALRHALTDRDWQVRQAAEDLLGSGAGGGDDNG